MCLLQRRRNARRTGRSLNVFCLEVVVVSGQGKKLWPEASTFYGKAQRKV